MTYNLQAPMQMWPLPGWEGTALGHQRLAFSRGAQILGHRPLSPDLHPSRPSWGGQTQGKPPKGVPKSIYRIGDHGQRAREGSGEGTPWRKGREGRPRRLGDSGAEVAGGGGERVQEIFLSYRLAAWRWPEAPYNDLFPQQPCFLRAESWAWAAIRPRITHFLSSQHMIKG